MWIYRGANAPENLGFWTNVVPAEGGRLLRLDVAADVAGAAAGTAVRLDIAFAGPAWCGIVVASAPGYWGDRPGPGLDLRGAEALLFRGRGERGGERVRVKAAVAGDQPYGDSAVLPIDAGWLELTADWREYRVPTDGRDLARVVTPFMLLANDKHNPAGRLTVFLDQVRYERDRAQAR